MPDDPRTELDQLREALRRRPVIDLAKGVIMTLRRCDEDVAFSELRERSQRHNIKLHDLAEALVEVVARGTGPAAGPRPDQPAHGRTTAEQVVHTSWTCQLGAGGSAAET